MKWIAAPGVVAEKALLEGAKYFAQNSALHIARIEKSFRRWKETHAIIWAQLTKIHVRSPPCAPVLGAQENFSSAKRILKAAVFDQ